MTGRDGGQPPGERERAVAPRPAETQGQKGGETRRDDPDRTAGPPRDSVSRDRLLRPFVEDPALWPVLLAVVLTASTLGAALLVLAIADRNPPALAAVVLVAAMTVFALEPGLRRGRLGLAGAALLLLWALSGAGAFAYLQWLAG